MVGIYPDEETEIIDLRECTFDNQRLITANRNRAKDNRWRIVYGYLSDNPLDDISEESPIEPMPGIPNLGG